MQKIYGQIVGWGMYVPERIVTNHDLEKTLDTSHDWIVKRTGIHARRVAAAHETTATMATKAAWAALKQADLDPTDIDLIIVATNTPDHLVAPSTASLVQHYIGASNVPALDLSTGCTGFLYGLSTAQQFIAAGTYKHVMIIGAELLSRFINWEDRSTAVLFGDGAGALILQATPEPCGAQHFVLGSDGSQADHIIIPAGGSAEPFTPSAYAAGRHYVHMNGREVFKFATRVCSHSVRQVLDLAQMDLDDIDWYIPHQANLRIINAAARDLDLPLDRFIINIEKYANTSAASIPIALCEGIADGRIQRHHKLMLTAFGAGLTWGACMLQLSPIKQPIPAHATPVSALHSSNGHTIVEGVAKLTTRLQEL